MVGENIFGAFCHTVRWEELEGVERGEKGEEKADDRLGEYN